MTTLKDIRDYMVNELSSYSLANDGSEYYDEDGHCGDDLLGMIKEYWSNFNSDKDFTYVVSAQWMSDDLDLEGGRSYIITEKLTSMLFDYMYNTLGWTKEKYEDCIFNSVQLTDELCDMFDEIPIVRDAKIENILCKPKETKNISPIVELNCISIDDNYYGSCTISIGSRYKFSEKYNGYEQWIDPDKKCVYIIDDNDDNIEYPKTCFSDKIINDVYIPHVVKYHKDRKSTLDNYEELEFVGKSKINNDYLVYKIKSLGVKIPGGYEVVKSVDQILNEN